MSEATPPAEDRRRVWARRLLAVALLAGMVLAAQAEYELAVAVGWPPLVAGFAPVGLDVYVMAAVLVDRNVGRALLVAAGSVVSSHGVYAAPFCWAGAHLIWPLAAVCSATPLLVAWQVHALTHELAAKPAKRTTAKAAESPAPRTVKPAASPTATSGPVAVVGDDLRAMDAKAKAEWFRAAVERHPERTAAEWAAATGLGKRTIERILPAVRPEPAEASAGILAAGGAR